MMMTWWGKLLERGRTGTLFVSAMTLVVCALLYATGGAKTPLMPLLFLPLLLAIVRCSFETIIGIGLFLSGFYLLLHYQPSGPVRLTATAMARALTLNAVTLIGAIYAKRVQRERQQLEHTVEEKEALLNVSQMVNAADKLEDALNRALLMLRTLLPNFQCAAIFLADEGQRQMELAAVLNTDPSDLRFDRFSLAEESPDWDPESGGPLYVPDLAAQRGPLLATLDTRARSAVCLALRSLRLPVGMLYVSSDHPDGFSDSQIRLLRAFADRVGFPLRKIRIQEGLQGLAFTDGMTGLYNFRSFRARLEEEMKRSARYERPLALILLDLDGFKGINDRYGHPAGDRMLVGLGEILRTHVRETDVPARYGGEEFAIICPEIAAEDAAVVAERVRRAVEAERFQLAPDELCAVTVSLGVASYPLHAQDESALVRAADDALYHAKRSGKNRVVVAREAETAPTESAS